MAVESLKRYLSFRKVILAMKEGVVSQSGAAATPAPSWPGRGDDHEVSEKGKLGMPLRGDLSSNVCARATAYDSAQQFGLQFCSV